MKKARKRELEIKISKNEKKKLFASPKKKLELKQISRFLRIQTGNFFAKNGMSEYKEAKFLNSKIWNFFFR